MAARTKNNKGQGKVPNTKQKNVETNKQTTNQCPGLGPQQSETKLKRACTYSEGG